MNYLPYIAITLTVYGWIVLFYVDWKIGLGVFLIMWGHQINKQLEKERLNYIIDKVLCSLECLTRIKPVEHEKDKPNNGEINN